MGEVQNSIPGGLVGVGANPEQVQNIKPIKKQKSEVIKKESGVTVTKLKNESGKEASEVLKDHLSKKGITEFHLEVKLQFDKNGDIKLENNEQGNAKTTLQFEVLNTKTGKKEILLFDVHSSIKFSEIDNNKEKLKIAFTQYANIQAFATKVKLKTGVLSKEEIEIKNISQSAIKANFEAEKENKLFKVQFLSSNSTESKLEGNVFTSLAKCTKTFQGSLSLIESTQKELEIGINFEQEKQFEKLVAETNNLQNTKLEDPEKGQFTAYCKSNYNNCLQEIQEIDTLMGNQGINDLVKFQLQNKKDDLIEKGLKYGKFLENPNEKLKKSNVDEQIAKGISHLNIVKPKESKEVKKQEGEQVEKPQEKKVDLKESFNDFCKTLDEMSIAVDQRVVTIDSAKGDNGLTEKKLAQIDHDITIIHSMLSRIKEGDENQKLAELKQVLNKLIALRNQVGKMHAQIQLKLFEEMQNKFDKDYPETNFFGKERSLDERLQMFREKKPKDYSVYYEQSKKTLTALQDLEEKDYDSIQNFNNSTILGGWLSDQSINSDKPITENVFKNLEKAEGENIATYKNNVLQKIRTDLGCSGKNKEAIRREIEDKISKSEEPKQLLIDYQNFLKNFDQNITLLRDLKEAMNDERDSLLSLYKIRNFSEMIQEMKNHQPPEKVIESTTNKRSPFNFFKKSKSKEKEVIEPKQPENEKVESEKFETSSEALKGAIMNASL